VSVPRAAPPAPSSDSQQQVWTVLNSALDISDILSDDLCFGEDGRLVTRGLMYKDLRGFLSKTLRTPKFGKLLRTNKSGCINPCVSTISRRFSLYIPINVKLCARARARLSAQSPPSFNMLISINRPAVVRLLGERR
jgi:hypothetical protein